MARMKTITILEAALVLPILKDLMGSLPPSQKYHVLKIQEALEHSVELIQMCMTEGDEENKWLEGAESLPFQPLDKGKFFASFDTLKPAEFLALKKLCV